MVAQIMSLLVSFHHVFVEDFHCPLTTLSHFTLISAKLEGSKITLGMKLNMRSSNTLLLHGDLYRRLCLLLRAVTEGKSCLIQGWHIRKAFCRESKVNISKTALSLRKLLFLCPAVCLTSAFSLSIVFLICKKSEFTYWLS